MSNIKYFTRPFRADNYKQHHIKQHPEHWSQYQAATEEEKKTFFDERYLVKETLHSYFG